MINDPLAHFEKLLDEFEEDALAAARDNSNTPSASKRHQYNLTRRNILAFVEEIVLKADAEYDKKIAGLTEQRDQIHEYLYDSVGHMSAMGLNNVAGLDNPDYCQAIIDKANEYKP